MAMGKFGINGEFLVNIAISITEGRSVRDLFYNGLLDYLINFGIKKIIIFTEATRVSEFVNVWKRPNIEFAFLHPCGPSQWRQHAFWMRRRIAKLGISALLNIYLRWEQKKFYSPRKDYEDIFQHNSIELLLTTHAHLYRESELISTAHHLGIPTLGVVRSWDNVYKGLRSRPQHLAVWNDINKQEVVDIEGYLPKNVKPIGSPQFDTYFDPSSISSRKDFAARFNLDPNRPILLFATLGDFIPELDETVWMETLLNLIDEQAIERNPQVICRLHPHSRLIQFQRFEDHPDVRISHVNSYWPSLQWYMTRDEMIDMANLLHHADVVITPGSTVVLEAAIFDRPTVVPVFHPYQPERALDYFNTWVLGQHFGRIDQNNLVPIIRNQADFSAAVNEALNNPDGYKSERRTLVRDYVQFTDGLSTKRLAKLIIEIIKKQ